MNIQSRKARDSALGMLDEYLVAIEHSKMWISNMAMEALYTFYEYGDLQLASEIFDHLRKHRGSEAIRFRRWMVRYSPVLPSGKWTRDKTREPVYRLRDAAQNPF